MILLYIIDFEIESVYLGINQQSSEKYRRFYRERCANFLCFCLLGDILITFTGNYFLELV